MASSNPDDIRGEPISARALVKFGGSAPSVVDRNQADIVITDFVVMKSEAGLLPDAMRRTNHESGCLLNEMRKENPVYLYISDAPAHSSRQINGFPHTKLARAVEDIFRQNRALPQLSILL